MCTLKVQLKSILTKLGFRNKQSCKRCGCNIYADFNVPDYIWHKYVPKKYQNKSLCINCFVEFSNISGKPSDINMDIFFVL